MSESEPSKASDRAALDKVEADISSLFENLPTDYDERISHVTAMNARFRSELAAQFQEPFNAGLYELLIEYPPVDMDGKKRIQSWVREQLDRFDLSIKHPDHGYPCNLITMPGHDGKGVFMLESRIDRKRSHTTTDLHSLLDLPLTEQRIPTATREPRRGRG